MPLSRLTGSAIEDGTITTADLADNAVNSAKIGTDVIVAEDLANNAITTAEITDGAITQTKLNASVTLGAGYYIAKDGSISGNANGRDNLFRVNSNATTGNVTIAANNNASVTGPLTIGNGTTLTITNTGRLAII
tara:strand:+ start:4948 stop:5352 length:405 start_codon:yes stop_codon:yes gene_type:complete